MNAALLGLGTHEDDAWLYVLARDPSKLRRCLLSNAEFGDVQPVINAAVSTCMMHTLFCFCANLTYESYVTYS